MMELTEEEKTAIGMARQALEIAIHSISWRWRLCQSGDVWQEGEDCACCIGWEESHSCGCACHKRIRELDGAFDAALRMVAEKHHSWWWDRGITGKRHEERTT